ncbi:uncharacterized protein BDZ99DRAFT_262951 [Mytilinidion resinicola]|uniref:Heterokaryon incompatibility domain-containing protein n=1 Tax=Mytilinidion resinicola TaxID=574789 RepID=A0A6A6YTT3_9PEZI|nr:uncharacterized protein BDZ99DRAFT_262951 [Mytilinidion resinicola]KAF2812181.1 hypothetical protein BDZ99DRAFT_262951 [Mytilinidion resinicola]
MAAPSTTESPATSPYQALDDQGSGKDAIRLLQILPGSFDDDIKIELETHSIEEPPKYYALSYCWGHDISKTPATVNDYPLQITQNLEDGLRHLRSRTKTRTIPNEDSDLMNRRPVHQSERYGREESAGPDNGFYILESCQGDCLARTSYGW